VGTTTFLPANHYEDSELQPFVTNSFTRLPWNRGQCGCRALRCLVWWAQVSVFINNNDEEADALIETVREIAG
jgi:hypothetical protein